MRIGLFTDTYRPSINGIVFVVDSLKKHLEDQGHEVFVFCPGNSFRSAQQDELLDQDDHIIRFRSVKGAFYDDSDISLFFPPRVLTKIRDLELDVIHFFTPGQIGMMGTYAAHKTQTPLVAQHSTDLYEFVEHYPGVLPGVLALIGLLPFTVKVDGKDVREIMKLYWPRRGVSEWNRDIIEKIITLIYSKCDAVIALSRKSQQQLQSWQKDDAYRYDITLMPNGVDKIKPPTAKQLRLFREKWDIDPADEVFGFVGRLGAEKNLAILIPTLEKVVAQRPRARLLFVGDFEYRETLEEMAAQSCCGDRITFTGSLPREDLGVAYGSMDVFTFPSLVDTQGWVLHEAAHAGLPIVLIDPLVSEVVEPGVNGTLAENDSDSMAAALTDLLAHKKKRMQYGKASQVLARRFTEKRQVAKLAKLYKQIIADHNVSE